MASSDRISPTAHYTGYVWYRNGLSHPALRTRGGWLLYNAARPLNALWRAAGEASLEVMLLARHRIIDHLLGEAIERGEVGQVVEVAAGLSPRGHRFVARHDGLVYVEADLPAMCARKRAVLDRVGRDVARHHVVAIDALADGGPASLAAVGARLLDPAVGTCVITEGLLSYFDTAAVRGMWRRFAASLSGYPRGLYLSDLHLSGPSRQIPGVRAFAALLGAFARGAVHTHFEDAASARQAAVADGFADARVHATDAFAGALGLPPARACGHVHVVAARTGAWPGLSRGSRPPA